MRVKIYIAVDIDPEDYPVPADGDVTEELEEYTLVITGEDGNIVHLDFSSKTKGSA